MRRLFTLVTLLALLVCPIAARADVVLEWNGIAVSAFSGQSPFAQARFMASTTSAARNMAITTTMAMTTTTITTVNTITRSERKR